MADMRMGIIGLVGVTLITGVMWVTVKSKPLFLAQLAPTPTIAPTPTLNPSPTITPMPTATPTATPSATPRPTAPPRPTTTPTITPIPNPSANDIFGLTERFAAQYGVEAGTLRFIAQCESGFNSQARNLTYAGLYQFSPGAWTKYRTLMDEETNLDLRLSAEEAIQTAAYVLSIQQSQIWPSCVP